MLPYFRLGPFLVQLTGLALLLGVWVGSWLAEKQAAKVGIKPDLIFTLIFGKGSACDRCWTPLRLACQLLWSS